MSYVGEFEQLILFAVFHLGDDAYGVAIRDFIEERTGREVSSGAIYTTLGRLEERGLLRSRPGEQPEGRGRPRKHYAVQPSGARALVQSYEAMQAMSKGAMRGLSQLAES